MFKYYPVYIIFIIIQIHQFSYTPTKLYVLALNLVKRVKNKFIMTFRINQLQKQKTKQIKKTEQAKAMTYIHLVT